MSAMNCGLTRTQIRHLSFVFLRCATLLREGIIGLIESSISQIQITRSLFRGAATVITRVQSVENIAARAGHGELDTF
jgi:predicted transcriptional regulator